MKQNTMQKFKFGLLFFVAMVTLATGIFGICSTGYVDQETVVDLGISTFNRSRQYQHEH